MSHFWPYFAFYNTLYFRIVGAWLEELPYMKGVEVAVVLSWGLAVFGIISVGNLVPRAFPSKNGWGRENWYSNKADLAF